MRRESERLQDILAAISAIERYGNQERSAFDEQELIQVWMIHHLQIIGEAANAISKERLNNYPEIPWREIIGLRNILVHEYFKINRQAIWDIIQLGMPLLKVNVEKMLREIKEI